MRTYSLSSRIIYRLKLLADDIFDSWNRYVSFKMSRDKAKRIRNKVVEQNGRKVVDRRLMKKIKEYCRESFGSTSYWPWVVLYSEVRGEFIEGWMPNDYYRFEFLPRMNPEKFMRLSEAKTIDHKLFNKRIVEPIFFRLNNFYYDRKGVFKTVTDVENLLKKVNCEIIIKPDSGRSGNKIQFANSEDLNLKLLDADSDLVFQRVVKQHDELNKLYPHAINTIRVLTYINSEGKVDTRFAFLRFGIGGNRVDNTGKGGGWIPISLNGDVYQAAYNGYGLSIGEEHPNTGIKFSNLVIPNFGKVLKICQDAHLTFPYTRVIGWDVFINEEGKPKLLEWNANNPGFWNAEAVFGPFF